MENFEHLVNGGLKSESTLRKHRVVRKQLAHFLQDSMDLDDIALADVLPSFIVDFHLYLKQDCHLAHNTIWNYLTPLQMLLHKAHQQGLIATYPFADYHNRMEDTERFFLTREELDRLMTFPFDNNRKRAFLRDLFVFCCYTGLAYIDLKQLRKDNIVRNPIDNQLWIHTHRKKTGTEVNVKLLPIPLEILKRWGTASKDDRVFDVPSLAACNKMLGTITKKCNLQKHITWHVARHTMATVICLSNNMPIEVVGTLLGHKNIRSTQIYAKITKEKLSLEMDTLRQRLAPQLEDSILTLPQSTFPAGRVTPAAPTRPETPIAPSPTTSAASYTPPTADAEPISRSTRMTTARIAALLHAPLRTVETAIMELTGTANASAGYALDTALAVAMLIDTPEAKEFVKSIKERTKA